MKNNISNINITVNPNALYKKYCNYIELINQGSSFLSNKKYKEALEIFEKALYLSETLKDNYKINETKCNIGITFFFLENIEEAIYNIKLCFDYIYSICKKKIGENILQNLYLLCRSGANLCMCKITMNTEINNCSSIINDIIKIISKEKDMNKQLFCIKCLNNALFQVDSLINNNYSLYNLDENKNSSLYNNINILFIEAFNKYIDKGEIDPWLNTLNLISQKVEKFDDKGGIINILFNQQIAICIKNNIYFKNDLLNDYGVNKVKIKLINLIQNISKNNNNIIDDEYLNNIIADYKSKLLEITIIYKLLYFFEENIIKNQQQIINNSYINVCLKNKPKIKYDQNIEFNINSEYYLKLIFQYTIKYFNKNINDIKLKKELIKQINTAQNIINSKEIDISKIDISFIDPDISLYFKRLINSLFQIYNKSFYINILKKYFKIYKNKVKLKQKEIVKLFFEKQFTNMIKGDYITKINFGNSYLKKHFYKIEYEIDRFNSFNSKESKILKKSYEFGKIQKFVIGIKTKNILNKKENLLDKEKIKEPYLFMSLILKNRTIDLFFENEIKAKKWFYGIYCFCDKTSRNYKISSCSSYIIFRIKSKILYQLQKDIKQIDKVSFTHCIYKYFNKDKEKKQKLDNNNIIKNKNGEKEVKENKIIDNDQAVKLNKIKEQVLKDQKELRKKKDPEKIDLKVNKVLEDMCKYGIVTKIELKKEKKMNPNKFISTEEALTMENKDQGLFALGLLSKNLEDLGIETAIEKDGKEDGLDAATTALQFIINGMCYKKKYELRFDFGEKRNNELINNKIEYEKFQNNLKLKLSRDYNTPIDKIIVTFPQKGSFSVQVIFQDDQFNDLDLKQLENKFKNEKIYKELSYLKEIHTDVIMSGCKLTKGQLDARGNRNSGWGINEIRGGKPYNPPLGYIGIGLKVMGKFENDLWIGMNNSNGEWCVAYHGVGRGNRSSIVKDITGKIIKGGFKAGINQAHQNCPDKHHLGNKVGSGVYCTPNISTAEGYSGISNINGQKYRTVLMVRVKPSAIRQCNCINDYWVVNGTTDEIRPYRILYKKC